MTPDRVLYHGHCTDGFTAAWVARRRWPGVRTLGVHHGEPAPPESGEALLLVDFCYPREELLDLAARARELRVLDHHASAQAQVGDLAFCTFDMERSGARLAWDFAFPGREPPSLVDYVEDRDLWRFELPDSEAITAWIQSWPMRFEVWDEIARLLETSRSSVVREGRAIARDRARTVERQRGLAREVTLLGHRVRVANTSAFSSELGHLLSEGVEAAILWRQRADGGVACEIRSGPEGLDCAVLAGRLGGGGHPRAAGFRMDSLEEWLRMLGSGGGGPA